MRRVFLVTFLPLALAARGGPAHAGDEAPSALESRLYDVGGLTQPRAQFVGEAGPFVVPPDSVNEETDRFLPVEERESEEEGKPRHAVNRLALRLDEVMEQVRAATPQGTWEAEGVTMEGLGASRLLVRAPARVQQDVFAALVRIEGAAASIAALEARAAEGDAAAARGEGGVPGAVASGALSVAAAARASGFLGQRVVGAQGGMAAFLVDLDVEIAQKSETTDPVVGVVKDGLSFAASAALSGASLAIDLDAWLARPGPIAKRPAGETDSVESVDVEGRSAHATFLARPGAWTLVPSSGTVAFAVRATVRAPATPPSAPPPLDSVPADGEPGPLSLASLPVQDLLAPLVPTTARPVFLAPTNFTFSEPSEPPATRPAVSADALLQALKDSGASPLGSAFASVEGASLQVVGDAIVARHDARRRAALERLLGAFRARLLRPLRIEATVVTVPAASFPAPAPAAGGGILADVEKDGGRALLALPGAQVADRAGVRVLSGARAASTGGRSRSYVGDWDVETAESSKIGDPIVHHVLDGIALDVAPTLLLGGGEVACEVRLDRSTWRPMRTIATRHGVLDLPAIGVARFRGAVVLPLGGTTVLAAGRSGDDAVVVLLSVSAD